jgi:predicted nucleic-acid-binding Zn-ribbon protein
MLKKLIFENGTWLFGVCDKCGGNMRPAQTRPPTNWKRYLYECEECGWTEFYQKNTQPG